MNIASKSDWCTPSSPSFNRIL